MGLLAVVATALVAIPGALGSPPWNDSFWTPVGLVGELDERSGTNVDATREDDEPDHAGIVGGASVWFSWMAPRDGILVIDTCDATFDTLLAMYTGSSLALLDEVAADDDSCGPNGGSAIEAQVFEDEVYRIAVDGVAGATGAFTLWLGMIPLNDDFVDAVVLSGSSGSTGGDSFLASHEAGEPLHAASRGTGSVWYSWTAPADLATTFKTCGQSGGDTLIGVYTGSSVNGLTPIVADDNSGCGLTYSNAVFDASAGTTYWIAVDGKIGWQFFDLEWETEPLRPRNLTPPTISGSPKTNQRLVASPGSWLHATSFSFVWYSCPNSGPRAICTPITNHGPRMEELRVPASELGRRIRVDVTAAGPNGSTTVRSFATLVITVGPPVNIAAPQVQGTPLVGRRITATEGTWDLGGGVRSSLGYRWWACDETGKRCSDETAETDQNWYTVTPHDRGRLIQVEVTMRTNGGSTTVLASTPGVVPRPPASVARCRVPRVVGKTLRAARKSLLRSRCRLGKVRRSRSARKRGFIVRQSPKPGTRLRAGGRVNVVLSLGRRR